MTREKPAQALARVLEAEGPALRRLARAWTKNDAETDDLFQDMALSLLVALPTFRGDCPERAFVWRVAANRALLAARRRRRQEPLEPIEFLEPHLASKAANPHDVLVLHEQQSRLRAAVAALPEDQRLVVILSLEGMSHQEIGDVVGASANAVGVRLHRGRATLTKAMNPPALQRSA
jgi:RNA polymerase sigma-70 factor (ECF subfamily)